MGLGRIGTAADTAITQLHAAARGGDAHARGLIPLGGNRVEVLEGVDEFVPRLVEDIANARRQVNMSMYALQAGPADGIATRVVAALGERAAAGIPVTVQLDAVGSQLAHPFVREQQQLVRDMRSAGIDVRIKPLTPTRAGLDDARFAVDHRKLIEVDGRISYQGGINLVDDWSTWQDMMVRVEGPSAAQGGALLAARWRDLGGDVTATRLAVLEDGLRGPVDAAGSAVRQLANGNRHDRELTRVHQEMVDGAVDHLRIANPYLADADIMRSIVAAARRGVDVELLLPPKANEAGDVLTDPLRRAWAARIHEAGGTVIRLPTFSHAKATIADGHALIGSLNLDRASNRRNYETAIQTSDPATLARLSGIFDAQRAIGSVLDDDSARDWLHLARVRDVIGMEY